MLTDAEKRSLRPRLRFRVLITFSNGSVLPIEFIDGSTKLIDQSFNAQLIPDLNQNDLDNTVVVCDVARVELLPGSPIEVFMPVEITEWEQVITTVGDDQFITFTIEQEHPPQFTPLEVDQIDFDGNVVLRQNIGVRDVPAPVDNLLCGSVVAIIINGTLSAPFLDGVDDGPSYDNGDLQTVAGIGGRFEFIVTVR